MDGEDTGSPGSFIPNQAPIEIGGRSIGEAHMFKGTMDDFRIYSRALKAAEIAKLASGALGSTEILQCNGARESF